MLTAKPLDKIIISFKRKKKSSHLSRQDRNHIRLIGIHNLIAKDIDVFNFIMNHNFKELFRFDKKTQTAKYIIKFKKGVLKNGKSESNDKSN